MSEATDTSEPCPFCGAEVERSMDFPDEFECKNCGEEWGGDDTPYADDMG
jgi:predicted RNA-binding Zn-ribbon protein involved in translation (DUF1610 family)